MNEQWGLCKDCKWWQIEPDAFARATTIGTCIENDLQPFALRVSWKSGCNHFSSGKPARAAGSSQTPQETAAALK